VVISPALQRGESYPQNRIGVPEGRRKPRVCLQDGLHAIALFSRAGRHLPATPPAIIETATITFKVRVCIAHFPYEDAPRGRSPRECAANGLPEFEDYE